MNLVAVVAIPAAEVIPIPVVTAQDEAADEGPVERAPFHSTHGWTPMRSSSVTTTSAARRTVMFRQSGSVPPSAISRS